MHFAQAAHPGIAVSVPLFGIGEAAFHGLFSSFVDMLAHPIEPMLIDAFLTCFPHMPRNHLGRVRALRALLPHRAAEALFGIDRYKLKLLLMQLRLLQHESKIQKAPVKNESLS